uniref:Sulfate_transp domain-containing protein n=1 Tax=Angiostrongylus cantonensis TaxID=6313 RepID=A0A0K0DN60_ANGCA
MSHRGGVKRIFGLIYEETCGMRLENVIRDEEYDAEYGNKQAQRDPVLRQLGRPFLETIFSFMPILDWLPHYAFKEDLMPDIIGGLTTGIMHVPQGLLILSVIS